MQHLVVPQFLPSLPELAQLNVASFLPLDDQLNLIIVAKGMESYLEWHDLLAQHFPTCYRQEIAKDPSARNFKATYKRAYLSQRDSLLSSQWQILRAVKDQDLATLRRLKINFFRMYHFSFIIFPTFTMNAIPQAIRNHFFFDIALPYYQASLSSGQDVWQVTDVRGNTLLYWAALWGIKAAVIEVIECCARLSRIDTLNFYGITPAFMAAVYGHVEILKLLEKKGANIHMRLPSGLTPLLAAARSGYLPTVRYLVDCRIDINSQTANGATPIAMAAGYGHVDVVRYLKQQGATMNTAVIGGYKPIFLAAESGQLAVVRYLVEDLQINPNTETDNGFTPTFAAACNGQLAVAKYLISKGGKTDVTIHNRDISLLYMAVLEGFNADIVDYLLSRDEKQIDEVHDGDTLYRIAERLVRTEGSEKYIQNFNVLNRVKYKHEIQAARDNSAENAANNDFLAYAAHVFATITDYNLQRIALIKRGLEIASIDSEGDQDDALEFLIREIEQRRYDRDPESLLVRAIRAASYSEQSRRSRVPYRHPAYMAATPYFAAANRLAGYNQLSDDAIKAVTTNNPWTSNFKRKHTVAALRKRMQQARPVANNRTSFFCTASIFPELEVRTGGAIGLFIGVVIGVLTGRIGFIAVPLLFIAGVAMGACARSLLLARSHRSVVRSSVPVLA